MDTLEDVCPSCGDYSILDEFTGWCSKCTDHIVNTSDVRYCVRCNSAFVSESSEFICHACKQERWANEIEHVMGTQNVYFYIARQIVALNHQATCLGCGDVMPHTTRGRHLFCSKQKCRSASRRLKYLRLGKGMTHSKALAQILSELQQKAQEAA